MGTADFEFGDLEGLAVRPLPGRGAFVFCFGGKVQSSENVIIGAGPAGLQMAYFMERAGRDYVVLDGSDAPGKFFSTYPRHRTLLSLNKVNNYYPEPEFNLRHDWNSLLSDRPELLFRNFSSELYPNADDLVSYLLAFQEKTEISVSYGERVSRVGRALDGRGFLLTTESGDQYTCQRLFVATGATRPYIPEDIVGIEHAEGYEDHALDQEKYVGKKIAIIGQGNSAFEVANHLAGHAAIIHVMLKKPVKHAWNTHFAGDLRAINNTILDMYQLKSLHATVGFQPKEIRKNPDGGFDMVVTEDYPHWTTPGTGRVTMHYDHVIRCTGWRYVDADLFDEDCRPKVESRGKFPVLDSSWQSTVPGIYFIGTTMQVRDRKSASSFIHGFRYNIRSLFHIVEERYHDVPLPQHRISLGDEEGLDRVARHIIDRVSTSSALYQQFGFLCDALLVEEGEVKVFTELPIDIIMERDSFVERSDLVVLTLEYGFHKYSSALDPVGFIHPADPTRPECSAFLHPVLRWFRDGVVQEQVDLTESLVVRYDVYDYEENFESAHVNRVKNLLNRVRPLTSQRFVERSYLAEDEARVFRAWTEEEHRRWRAARQPDETDPMCHYEN